MGALVHARVTRIVFGAADPRWGAAGSLYHLAEDSRLNHRPEVTSGVLQVECKAIIQNFFRKKRNQLQ
jgi:tRNA(adenine34) deaminase